MPKKLVVVLDKQKSLIALLIVICLFLGGIIIVLLRKPSQSGNQLPKINLLSSTPTPQKLWFSYDSKVKALPGKIIKTTQNNNSFLAFNSQNPLKIAASGQNDFEQTVDNITILQIINEGNINLDDYLGKEVVVDGSFMSSHTAHHLTDALLILTDLRLAQKQDNTNILKGYFATKNRIERDGSSVVCDLLVVTAGDEAVIADYKKSVNQGNTVNFIGEDGKLRVNLYLDLLDEKAKQKILSSTQKSPVTLGIYEPYYPPMEVPVCFSFFQITWVK